MRFPRSRFGLPLLALVCLVALLLFAAGAAISLAAGARGAPGPAAQQSSHRAALRPAAERTITLAAVEPQDVANPTFVVRPEDDSMSGWEWAPNSTVHVAIDDPGTVGPTDFTFDSATDENGNFDEGGIGYDIKAGYTVTVTQGATTKTTVVTALVVTGVDPVADTVSGTAAAGSQVEVLADVEGGAQPERMVTTNGSGVWTANFHVAGTSGDPDQDQTFDIIPGSRGEANQQDPDNDRTEANWYVPNPTFVARTKDDGVYGWEWAPNSTVHVAIDDPGTVGPSDFTFDSATDENGNFDEGGIGYDIKAGYTVTVTQGATTKTTVVTALVVTGVDPVADTVSGTAAPGSQVEVLADVEGGAQPERMVTTNGSGVWTANFHVAGASGDPDQDQTFDIMPGSRGEANQQDPDNDRTEADWYVPPVAVPDFYTTPQGVALSVPAPGVLSNDTPHSMGLTAIKVTDPAHGKLALNDDGSFLYTPTAGYHGTDSFTYKAADDGVPVPSNTVTVSITVTPPAVYKNVYRFRNLKNGFYLWSADENEKATIIRTLSKTWVYEGVAYQINTANPLNSSPLWRFVNINGGFYLYSADANEKNSIIANLWRTWRYEGPAYNVSTNPAGAPVWRFRNKRNGTYLYSADVNEKNYIVAHYSATWQLEGPAYYLAP